MKNTNTPEYAAGNQITNKSKHTAQVLHFAKGWHTGTHKNKRGKAEKKKKEKKKHTGCLKYLQTVQCREKRANRVKKKMGL